LVVAVIVCATTVAPSPWILVVNMSSCTARAGSRLLTPSVHGGRASYYPIVAIVFFSISLLLLVLLMNQSVVPQ